MRQAPTFREYLTIKEAACLLGVTPATLRNWDRAGKLTPLRHPLNGYRLYRREDLQALLEETFRAGKKHVGGTNFQTAMESRGRPRPIAERVGGGR